MSSYSEIPNVEVPDSWLGAQPLFQPPTCATAWGDFCARFPSMRSSRQEQLWGSWLQRAGARELQNRLTQTFVERLKTMKSSATDTLRALGWVGAYYDAIMNQHEGAQQQARIRTKWDRPMYTSAWNLAPLEDEKWVLDAALMHGYIQKWEASMCWGQLVKNACEQAEVEIKEKKIPQEGPQHEHLGQVALKHNIVLKGQKNAVKCMIMALTGLWAQRVRSDAGYPVPEGVENFERYFKDQKWNDFWALNEQACEKILQHAHGLLETETSYSNMKWDFFDGALDPLLHLDSENSEYDWRCVVQPVQLASVAQGWQIEHHAFEAQGHCAQHGPSAGGGTPVSMVRRRL